MNKDSYAKMVRADPLTGLVDCIPVSGDFRLTLNLIACITVDKKSKLPFVYKMEKKTQQKDLWNLSDN